MVSMVRTNASFARYRSAHQPEQSMNPDARRYQGDADQMEAGDGLAHWVDGPIEAPGLEPADRPELLDSSDGLRLWVVTPNHVLHAAESCEFGRRRGAGAAKHSNLTGGGEAFAGGELMFLDPATIAITGSSGRYRLRAAEEMTAIERAFAESGYNVWSMGYNQDTNRPNLFDGNTDLEWVSP